MKKYGSYLLYGAALVFAMALVLVSLNTNKVASEQKSNEKVAQVQNSKPAEKIQVFLFHATQRCSSCIAIGKYAKETVEQKFPDELKSGKIEFREINIDLPENKEVANKFKATGSSLFINPIYEGQDHIKDDTRVWQLVSNEQGFISYLSDK
jgi:disulfide oxidoreductase YuzD